MSRKIEPHFAFIAVTARGAEAEFPEKADSPIVRNLRGEENLGEPHLERPSQGQLTQHCSQPFLSAVLKDKNRELDLILSNRAEEGVATIFLPANARSA